MSYMFYGSAFNGNISQWDVRNVNYMNYMFCNSKFNGDISKWDVSEVKEMIGMLWNSGFRGNLNDWTIKQVEDMKYICVKKETTKPWWAIEDKKIRAEAIAKYRLMKKLETKLSRGNVTQEIVKV